MSIQLDFFLTSEQSELAHLRKEVSRIEESGHKVRRGTYKAINELSKKLTKMEDELFQIKHQLQIMDKFIKERL